MSSSAVGRIGSQDPRILHAPSDRKTPSAGAQAVALAASAGLHLDPWQQTILHHALAVRDDGLWCSSEVAVVLSRQNGKGDLKINIPLLTTDGWSTMGDVEAGQYVYGSSGTPIKVLAGSETYVDSECYEVEFTDGSTYVAGGDHLWRVRNKKASEPWRDMSTADLASRVGHKRTDNGRMEYNWRVRCDAVVDTPSAELPIDPYLLGYWLGDGTSTQGAITVGHEDRDWTVARLQEAGASVDRIRLHDHGAAWNVAFHLGQKGSSQGFLGQVRGLGIYNNKGIPEAYLTASIDQRKALLAGLMDSDGSIAVTNRSPQVEFTSSIPRLAEDFQRLARSLGIRVTRKDGKSSLYGVQKKDRARFLWTPTFNPFQMPRKAEKWSSPSSVRHELMSITSITRVPTVPTRCIQVDAEDGVYLVGHNFTPTHNSILEAIELWGLFINEEVIYHTAHNVKTSMEGFLRIEALILGCAELRSEVLRISHNNGAEGIELRNGARLMFGTRTKGAARGLTIDRVICDEAMYLTDMHMAALAPTMMAVPNSQIWYFGSAGTQESIVVGRARARALRGAPGRLCYAEWSIDPHTDFCPRDCDEHDDPYTLESWAKANPTLGDRISVEAITSASQAMSREMFMQEHLGVGDWPVEGDGWRIIPEPAWKSRHRPESILVDPFVLAVDTTPDRGFSSICAAGLNEDGFVHVEITGGEEYDHRPGTQWVVPAVVDMWKRQKPAAVVIDKASQAGAFIDALVAAGVKVLSPNAREFAQACGEFYSGVIPRKGEHATLVHLDQPPLNQALAGADTRELTDLWAWSKKNSNVDISPLVAATLAMWGHKKTGGKRRSRAKSAWG